MAHWVEELEKLCETVEESIAESNKKLRKGGVLSPSDADYLDKLTHIMKSIKSTIARENHKDGYDEGYSGTYYEDGHSYAGVRNMRRDSRGRFTRGGGYSYESDEMDMLLKELRRIEANAPDERSRREIKKLIRKYEDD